MCVLKDASLVGTSQSICLLESSQIPLHDHLYLFHGSFTGSFCVYQGSVCTVAGSVRRCNTEQLSL